MHFYIYDQFLNDSKYQAALNRIEGRLTDLGISGRTEKLTLLKSLPEAIGDIIKRGATTIVAVGNDATVSKIISLLTSHDVTLGIIPIGPQNEIARLLGIPDGEAACEALAARLVERIDLGRANDQYFINSLTLTAPRELSCDLGQYQISSRDESSMIHIYNFNPSRAESGQGNPRDGYLEAVFSGTETSHGFFKIFKRTYSQDSVFPFTKMKIRCSSECLPALADGHTTIKTPITVEVVPRKLRVIVGKSRMF